jgi:hypothetical protein
MNGDSWMVKLAYHTLTVLIKEEKQVIIQLFANKQMHIYSGYDAS